MSSSQSWLFFMDPDGSELRRVTTGGQERDVSLAPDGKLVAFGCGTRPRAAEICVVSTDGSEPRVLTDNRVEDGGPHISARGWIVFQRYVHGAGFELFKMRADGSRVTRLTQNRVDDEEASWSPDGRRIVFARKVGLSHGGRDLDYDLFMMRADGKKQMRLTSGSEQDRTPDWSPDGQTIAFARQDPRIERNSGGWLYTVDAEGSRLRRIVPAGNTHHRSARPRWSSDGSELLFIAERNGDLGVFKLKLGGTVTRLLSDRYDARGFCTTEVCVYVSADW